MPSRGNYTDSCRHFAFLDACLTRLIKCGWLHWLAPLVQPVGCQESQTLRAHPKQPPWLAGPSPLFCSICSLCNVNCGSCVVVRPFGCWLAACFFPVLRAN
jgi:hypothetical protein